MDKKNLIIFLVVILAVLVLGFLAGIFYQSKKDGALVEGVNASVATAEAAKRIANDINSKDITVDVRGFIKSVTNNSIILQGRENMPIAIKADTQINLLVQGTQNTTKEVKLSELKADYYVNAFIVPTATGSWTANKIYASIPTIKK